jgi:hypothetical protein
MVYYTKICLDKPRKRNERLSRVMQLPGKDFNPVTPEDEAEIIPTQQRCSLMVSNTAMQKSVTGQIVIPQYH